jgi:SAM-dependent methyltransferase
MIPDWPHFYEATKGREPRPLLPRALAAWGDRPPGSAVDLGAGDGTETFALLARGWRVTAVDSSPAAASLIRERVDPDLAAGLEILTVAIQEAPLPAMDLLYSGYSLPFVPPDAFPATWSRIREALRPGAILAANLFGPHDTWANDPDLNFHDRAEAEGLLEGLEVLDLQDQEEDSSAVTGPKHWHVIEFVARRPADV